MENIKRNCTVSETCIDLQYMLFAKGSSSVLLTHVKYYCSHSKIFFFLMDQLILYCSSAYLRLVAFACLLLVLLCNFFCIFKKKAPLSAKAREGMMVQVDPSNYRNFTSCNYGNSLNVKLALPIFLPLCICIPLPPPDISISLCHFVPVLWNRNRNRRNRNFLPCGTGTLTR